MPGHRFFVEPVQLLPNIAGTEVSLSEADSHHAHTVLRIAAGDAITVIFKGAGSRFNAEIAHAGAILTARITGRIEGRIPHSRVTRLVFALCKGERNDLVCEKATELGVSAVHFFQAQRSVVRIETGGDAQKKIVRWNKIAEAAAKQCNRSEVPQIMFSHTLADAAKVIAQAKIESVNFFCSLSAGSGEIKDIALPEGSASMIVGPEGDFTPEEETLMIAQSFKPLSLGPLTLRSETAALAAVAMANALWGFA